MTRTFGRLVLQLGAILSISCALSELALRAYDYFHPMFIFYDPSYDRFRVRPNSLDWGFKLNSGGFKDLEFGAKTPGAYRILALGDSFAFGVVPYRYNYLTLLEEELKRAKPAIELLNLGIPAIGPREYLALLVREGLALEPDAVLLSFFVGNDFHESRRPERPLYTYSHVASLVHYLFRVLPEFEGSTRRRRAEFSDYCDDCANLSDRAYLELMRKHSRVFFDGYGEFPELVDDAVESLAEIRKLCARRGIELFVVIIPDELQVNAELQQRVRAEFFPERSWNNTRPNDALAARLAQLGIEYLDLYPEFAAQASRAVLYRPRDSHWNIRGNRLAADLIAQHFHPGT